MATQTGVRCVRCQEAFVVEERLLLGEVLHCAFCNTQLEVFGLDPLEVGPRIRIEEEAEDFEGWTKAG